MKYLFVVLVCVFCAAAHAQRLYLNDIENGNYKSYDIGDHIEFTMTDSSRVVSGVISSFQRDGFTLNDTLKVKISQIATLVKPGGGNYTVGRVLLIVLGSYLLLSGVTYAIVGVAFLAAPSNLAPVGVIALLFGAGMGAGGYAIINNQVKKARNKTTIRQPLDGIHYRLLVE